MTQPRSSTDLSTPTTRQVPLVALDPDRGGLGVRLRTGVLNARVFLDPYLDPYRSCLLCLMRLLVVLGVRG